MFCKDCGKQIEANSRFCSHCGALQKQPQFATSPQQVVSPQTVQKLEGVFGINLSKPIVGIYLVWFLLHLILLLTNWKASSYANEHFYPFGKNADLEDYDLTEFLLYTLVPLIILVIVNLFTKPREIQLQNLQTKYDMTFEKDPTPTVVGVVLIIFSMAIYFASSTNKNISEEQLQQTRAIMSLISVVLRIGITVWVVDIAKKLNRDRTGWGIFAFFLPSIALIVIGQKRKLRTS